MEEKNFTPEAELQNMESSEKETIEETIVANNNSEASIDYSEYSRAQMVEHLSKLVSEKSPLEIKNEIERIKSAFYLKLTREIVEQKAAFIEANTVEGEETPEFKPERDQLEIELKAELARFRKLKNEIYEKQEQERQQNLTIKEGLIEELKQLIETEESLEKTFEAFRNIQERWRATGHVPIANNNDLWQTYHLHVEHFYDYININKELRDLDFKKNLEVKTQLCDKAEALNEKKSVIDAFKELQTLHQNWKEIGPVDREFREPLWERFKAATTIINKRHQDHFAQLKEKEVENLKKKEELCDKAEAIANMNSDKAKEWNDKVVTIQDLQAEWRTIGPVPKKNNADIYRRFRKACDDFFNNKRNFYKSHKDEQSQNLDLKRVLLKKAIEIKDSEDWKETTDALITLQKEWKEIGPVPRNQSNKIWNEFRGACDVFFDRKKNHFGDNEESQKENLTKKEALIEEIKTFAPTESAQDDIKSLLKFKDEWMKIGHVPIKAKNKINNDYRHELNAQFDKLNLNRDEREMEKFRSKLEDINDNDGDKLYAERKRLSMKLKEMETEISTWENNLGFLAKSKNSEGLLKEYQNRIEKAKVQKLLVIKKIRLIDTI